MMMAKPRQLAGNARHAIETAVWRSFRGSRFLLSRDLKSSLRGPLFGDLPLDEFEFSEFSQNGEDGVIEAIFQEIGVTNRVAVEIGAASGSQNNTRRLLEAGWRGIWVEGNASLAAQAEDLSDALDLYVLGQMVGPNNIDALLLEAETPAVPDILSLDIDGDDLRVLRVVLGNYSPRVIIHEINSEHRFMWAMGPRSSQWAEDWNYGASLGAFGTLLVSKGYKLVHVDSMGVNAFWVRIDELSGNLPSLSHRHSWRPATHRRGTVGHPRVPCGLPPMSYPINLESVSLEAYVIDRVKREGCTTRFAILLSLTNCSPRTITSGGSFPVRIGYTLGGSVSSEPDRMDLGMPIRSGRKGCSGSILEFDDSIEPIVNFRLVQENLRWSDLSLTVKVS